MEMMLTARQVAELLGVHENWVYDHAASGDLPSYKIGGSRRFDPDEVHGWIGLHRENGREHKPPEHQERAPAAGSSRAAQPEDPVPETPKRRRNRVGGQAADDTGEVQPRLFET